MSEAAPVATAIRLQALLAQPRPQQRRPSPEQLRKAAHAAGRAEAEAEWQPRFEALEADFYAAQDEAASRATILAAEARAATAALVASFATELARLGVAIAGQILEAEPGLQPETLAALIREALSAAEPGDLGLLRVHPAALDVARGLLPPGWALAADPALAPGDALAEAGPMLALASLSNRLAQAEAALGGRP